MVATALEQMLPQARAKGIQLSAHPEVGRRVSGDRRRVFQILLNLISNALKFTPEAGAVEVAGSSDGERVMVTVTDTGVGIPVELLDRIFDEFTQVESGTTRNQEGTGLGLALSRRLAELMGGSLEVASVPGRGSTFTLELPLMVTARKGS